MDAGIIINKLKNHHPTLYNIKNMRKYAVLLPLIEKNGETHLLFEVRSMHLRSQPGDVCFPGGRVDSADVSEQQGALRETSEELGISMEDIKDVYPIDIMISSPEQIVYPFVGRLNSDVKITPNKAEVSKTFTVPLQYFLNTKPRKHKVTIEAIPADDFPYHLIVGGEEYNWRHSTVNQYFYSYNHQVIWGLTANIILNFLSLIQEYK